MNGHRNEIRKEKNNKPEDKYRKNKCLTNRHLRKRRQKIKVRKLSINNFINFSKMKDMNF